MFLVYFSLSAKKACQCQVTPLCCDRKRCVGTLPPPPVTACLVATVLFSRYTRYQRSLCALACRWKGLSAVQKSSPFPIKWIFRIMALFDELAMCLRECVARIQHSHSFYIHCMLRKIVKFCLWHSECISALWYCTRSAVQRVTHCAP